LAKDRLLNPKDPVIEKIDDKETRPTRTFTSIFDQEFYEFNEKHPLSFFKEDIEKGLYFLQMAKMLDQFKRNKSAGVLVHLVPGK